MAHASLFFFQYMRTFSSNLYLYHPQFCFIYLKLKVIISVCLAQEPLTLNLLLRLQTYS